MPHPTIHLWRHATAFLSLVLLASACGPVPTYARLGASGQEPGAGGFRDAGSGGASAADDGGTPSGGVGARGGQAGGGAVGTGGRMDAGSDGMGSGGVNPATGGSPVATGGAGAATGGAGAASGGTGGVILGSGGSPPGTGGADKGGRGGGGAGSGGTTSGTGGGSVDGGAMGPANLSNYAFEGSVQGWTMAGGSSSWSAIACSNAASFAGTGSLAGTLSARSGAVYILEVEPPTPAIPAGATVSFHLRVPAAAMLTAVQPYVMETGTFRFTGTRIGGSDLARNTWVKIDVNVPKDAASILRVGVQFESSGTWSDTIYLDAIDW